MTTIFYARVSTADQHIEHQVKQAEALGYRFDHVLSDQGLSGISTRLKERPEGKRLYDLLRTGDTLVVRWVDRLGRNYADVTDAMREFIRKGVIIRTIINGLEFDGSTDDPIKQAVRDAMIAFMAATAQAQAEATKIAQKSGIEAAKAKPDRYKGRKPTYGRAEYSSVMDLIAQDAGTSAIANTTGLSRQTVLRIKADPVAAEKALAVWGL